MRGAPEQYVSGPPGTGPAVASADAPTVPLRLSRGVGCSPRSTAAGAGTARPGTR